MKVGGGTLFLLAHALWSLSFGAPKLAAAPGELLDIIPRLLGSVTGLELDDQGRVYVAGIFTIEGESTARTLIRLRPDGSLDPSFHVTVGTGSISALEHHGGKLLVAGSFATLNSDPSLVGIGRLHLDGSIDASFKPPQVIRGSGGGLTIRQIHVTSTGDILLTGQMKVVGYNTSFQGIARLGPNGGILLRERWQANPTSQFQFFSRFVETMPSGTTVCAGDHGDVNYQTHGSIFELDSAGEMTSRFLWATNHMDTNFQRRVMAMLPDDTVIKEGTNRFTADKFPLLAAYLPGHKPHPGFESFQVFPKSNLSGLSFVHVQPDGKLVVVGVYRLDGEEIVHQVIRLNADGSLDDSFRIPKLPADRFKTMDWATVIQDSQGRIWVGCSWLPQQPLQGLYLLSGEPESLIPRLYAVPMPDGTLQLRYKAHSGAQKWVAQRSATFDGGWEDVATPDQPDKYGSATIDTTQIPTPAYFRLRRATMP